MSDLTECNQDRIQQDNLKRNLSDFIELLNDRLSDVLFDKNYVLIKQELKKLEDKLVESGSSIVRPEEPVIGQQYFDTSLGKPIFFSGVTWVDANGTEV